MIPAPLTPLRELGAARGWQAAYRDAVSDPLELLDLLGLPHSLLGPAAHAQFPTRVPRSFVARMRPGDTNDPLLLQVLPLHAEMDAVPGFNLLDPVGDSLAKSATGVIQKYRGRALLITTGACAIHCRYCFRRHFPYAEESAAGGQWSDTLQALQADETIDEVILSGGDPLSLSTRKLRELTEGLRGTAHIRRLRIHSRLPVTLPERIDEEFIAWLAELPWPVTMVVHANHANEFDAQVDHAMKALRAANVTLLNQAVLLKGINDSVDALRNLSERGFEAGVLPYYLHVLDKVQGAGHFAITDEQAIALHQELATQLSGYLVPKLVREIQGHSGKTPIHG